MEDQDSEFPFCVRGILAELEFTTEGQNLILSKKDRDRRRWIKRLGGLLQRAESELAYLCHSYILILSFRIILFCEFLYLIIIMF